MDPRKKADWVAALRSGEYLQGTEVLHRRVDRVDRYCCLGVLCDVAIKSGLQISTSARPSCSCGTCQGSKIHMYGGHDDFLPPKVVEWAGLTNGNPTTRVEIDGLPGPATLSHLNDNGKTFSEIADIIERDL